MFFQIEKVILWSKDKQKKPRIISFELNKVNLITGSSKTGKSSIIPIIDYCLGSSKCSIPVNTIRDTTSWYGVQIKTSQSRLLIARKDPNNQNSTSNAFFVESSEIEIPQFISTHTINIDDIKIRLNEIIGVSNINFDFYKTGRLDKFKTSLRDLAAFNYQPQNILANPNALFYKTDSLEHKSKLITILPYVLGALSNEDLEKIHELRSLEERFNKVEKKYLKLKKENEHWIATAQAYVIKAIELGLLVVKKDIKELTLEQILNLLNIVSKKEMDNSIGTANIKFANEQEILLIRKSKEISEQIGKIKSRLINLSAIHEVTNNHTEITFIKRNRLYFSKWLIQQKEIETSLFIEPNKIKTLVLEPLARAFDSLESELEVPEKIQGVFSREKLFLENELNRFISELNDVKEQINILSSKKKKSCYDSFAIGVFVGQVKSALKIMSDIDEKSELTKEYNKLNLELSQLRKKVIPSNFQKKTELQLQKVNKLATAWLPHLDTENPNAPVSLSAKELTVTVNNNGRRDYLWEIGSGANWVSYHIAITLALHQHFSTLTHCPVPNYMIYDQPSQVYFPSKLHHHRSEDIQINNDQELDLLKNDEDIVQVQKIFKVFSDAIDKTNHNLQIIVLDHAPLTMLEEVKNGHLVEEWRNNIKLIPLDWLDNE